MTPGLHGASRHVLYPLCDRSYRRFRQWHLHGCEESEEPRAWPPYSIQTSAKVVSEELAQHLAHSLLISQSISMEIADLLGFLCLTASQKIEVRKHVVLRVKFGETVASIAHSVPFTARTIYHWIVRFSLGIFNNMKDRNRTVRPRK